MLDIDNQLAFGHLRRILGDQLCPMFPGTAVDTIAVPSGPQRDRVADGGKTSLLLQPRGIEAFQLRLKGRRPFECAEIKVIKSLVEVIGDIWAAFDKPYFPSLAQYCDQEVVARSVKRKIVDDSLIPLVLQTLDTWSNQTYEGGRIAAAIGIDPKPKPTAISRVHFSEFMLKDFAKVLTNGMDVLLVLSPSGHVVEHIALPAADSPNQLPPPFVPIRVHAMATWATSGRVAFVLNRLGETLVLDSARLRFAKRRGGWFHLAHGAVIHRMGNVAGPRLLKSVYETCLDISFGRHGGCIAIVKDGKRHILDKCLPSDELLSAKRGERTRVLNHCLGSDFSKLSRLIRLSIASADGAVVLDRNGRILAAGSIVRVRGGSESGGRRAAAVALSRTGMAVKISADGGMVCFGDCGSLKCPTVLFEVFP